MNLTERHLLQILKMTGFGHKSRTQLEVSAMLNNKYPEQEASFEIYCKQNLAKNRANGHPRMYS